MTKADLVAKVAGDSKITKAQAEKAVDGFVAAVSAALAGGAKAVIREPVLRSRFLPQKWSSLSPVRI